MFPAWRPAYLLLLIAASATGARTPPSRSAPGERMYREGLLPSGAPIQGVVKGDVPMPGRAVTCAHCHMRGGLGSTEGGVITPPVNAPRLFQPSHRALPRLTAPKREHLGLRTPPLRPAYTDAALAQVIRTGHSWIMAARRSGSKRSL